MAVVLQLSDLHITLRPEQDELLAALVDAIRRDRAERGRKVGLIAVTGDVFDSSAMAAEDATQAFGGLLEALRGALGDDDPPCVIVPGNHDRRRGGFVGPNRRELFDALRDRLGDRAHVHGCGLPFLASVVPERYHRMPLHLIAYDSTYLPRGLLSAGGSVRQEDLLHAAAQIDGRNPDWPVLVLLHHHLVPTPLTDFAQVETGGSAILRWSVRSLLPALVAHGDREELTMTALGAGTALSTLHTLGRAVLVLHGHKHYASARMLGGIRQGEGDVLLVSAGSGGTAQTWYPGPGSYTARLWPSFNVIELDADTVMAETVSFGYRGEHRGQGVARPMLCAERRGARWIVTQIDPVAEEIGPRLLENDAVFVVFPGATAGRLDYRCERRILAAGDEVPHYVETVEALPGASLVVGAGARRLDDGSGIPAEVELDATGPSHYNVKGGIASTLAEASAVHGDRASPFEWVGLMCRYESKSVRMEVRGLASAAAFASATDLGTGLERPVGLARDGDRCIVTLADCAARTLVRVYFPLGEEPLLATVDPSSDTVPLR